jgi:hypothetical protein
MAFVSIAGTLPGLDRDREASGKAEMSVFTSTAVELFPCRVMARDGCGSFSMLHLHLTFIILCKKATA